MRLSARNQLPGTVVSVNAGPVTAEVVLKIAGGQRIVSVITAESARRLALRKGKKAVAIIKSTDVLIATD